MGWRRQLKMAFNIFCTVKEMGGLGVPNLSQKGRSLVLKWMLTLETDKPWTLITRTMIKEPQGLPGQ